MPPTSVNNKTNSNHLTIKSNSRKNSSIVKNNFAISLREIKDPLDIRKNLIKADLYIDTKSSNIIEDEDLKIETPNIYLKSNTINSIQRPKTPENFSKNIFNFTKQIFSQDCE